MCYINKTDLLTYLHNGRNFNYVVEELPDYKVLTSDQNSKKMPSESHSGK